VKAVELSAPLMLLKLGDFFPLLSQFCFFFFFGDLLQCFISAAKSEALVLSYL